jgi:hypothetical protein
VASGDGVGRGVDVIVLTSCVTRAAPRIWMLCQEMTDDLVLGAKHAWE